MVRATCQQDGEISCLAAFFQNFLRFLFYGLSIFCLRLQGMGQCFFCVVFLYAKCFEIVHDLLLQEPLVGEIDDRSVQGLIQFHGRLHYVGIAGNDGTVEGIDGTLLVVIAFKYHIGH